MVDFGFVLKKIISSALLPPLGPALLILVGLIVLRNRKRLGLSLIAVSAIGTIVLASNVVGSMLLASLQDFPPFDSSRSTDAKAIVILAGGLRKQALEYGRRDELNTYTLERVRFGAWLARKTQLPILVTGGSRYGQGPSEAEVMARALQQEFNLRARWLESDSKDTADNARYSKIILQGAGISKVLLVTNAWHMKRSLLEFESVGLSPTAAATGYVGTDNVEWQSYLPTAKSYLDSSWALHEWLGILWMRIRGR